MQQPWCNACVGRRCKAWDDLLQDYHLLFQGNSNAVSGGAAKLGGCLQQRCSEHSNWLCREVPKGSQMFLPTRKVLFRNIGIQEALQSLALSEETIRLC